jgi:uracil-DNA glycosylase family 4
LQPLHSCLTEIKKCTACEHLQFGPNPVVQASERAKILIIGQAPGKKVHDSGIPFNDASGDRLRSWLGVSREHFYDPNQFAIMPMGFCYPGKGKSGDLPPSKLCAPMWHQKVLSMLPNIQLTLLIGQYAQKYYLDEYSSLTETVQNWHCYLPRYAVLPHPSPRNQIWLKNNPWFEEDFVSELRRRTARILSL